jgi:hypothetical protein
MHLHDESSSKVFAMELRAHTTQDLCGGVSGCKMAFTLTKFNLRATRLGCDQIYGHMTCEHKISHLVVGESIASTKLIPYHNHFWASFDPGPKKPSKIGVIEAVHNFSYCCDSIAFGPAWTGPP